MSHDRDATEFTLQANVLRRVRDAMREKVVHRLEHDIPGGDPMRRLVLGRFDAVLSDAALSTMARDASAPDGMSVMGRLGAMLFDELLVTWRMLGHAVESNVVAVAALGALGAADDDGTGWPPSALH